MAGPLDASPRPANAEAATHARRAASLAAEGRMDGDGYLYVVDRKKDMIISGGYNIFPADIEAVVGEHPDVLDVAVIGVAHDVWGETPLAVVVPREGRAIDADQIREWANAKLGKTQRIAAVVLRPDFPRNALGKIQKGQLRAEYRDHRLAK